MHYDAERKKQKKSTMQKNDTLAKYYGEMKAFHEESIPISLDELKFLFAKIIGFRKELALFKSYKDDCFEQLTDVSVTDEHIVKYVNTLIDRVNANHGTDKFRDYLERVIDQDEDDEFSYCSSCFGSESSDEDADDKSSETEEEYGEDNVMFDKLMEHYDSDMNRLRLLSLVYHKHLKMIPNEYYIYVQKNVTGGLKPYVNKLKKYGFKWNHNYFQWELSHSKKTAKEIFDELGIPSSAYDEGEKVSSRAFIVVQGIHHKKFGLK